jgi:hypothetical protein
MRAFVGAWRFIALFAALSGCTTTAGLTYEPSGYTDPAEAMPVVLVGEFDDEREKKPTELGVVRGGYGNVVKRLVSERPVSELVQEAFADGLAARRLLAGDPSHARFVLDGTLTKLDSNYFFNKEAHAHMRVRLKSPDGELVFENTYRADNTEGGAGAGIFASMEDLRQLTERTLRQAIDRALDDNEFREAIAPIDVAAPAHPAADTPSRLEELQELRDRGLLDEQEYQEKRKAILDSL